MTDEEKKFRELCSYVKTDIMKYDDNQKLSKNMILRLRGLKDGKYIDYFLRGNLSFYLPENFSQKLNESIEKKKNITFK